MMAKKRNTEGINSRKIYEMLLRIQKILDKHLLREIATPKMSALTSCKGYLVKAFKYAVSYEKLLDNDKLKCKGA